MRKMKEIVSTDIVWNDHLKHKNTMAVSLQVPVAPVKLHFTKCACALFA